MFNYLDFLKKSNDNSTIFYRMILLKELTVIFSPSFMKITWFVSHLSHFHFLDSLWVADCHLSWEFTYISRLSGKEMTEFSYKMTTKRELLEGPLGNDQPNYY